MSLLAELVLVLLLARIAGWSVLGVLFHRRVKAAPVLPAPRLAVVVPAYNEEEELGATLDALRCCRPEPAEIVVVDDGSTDRTAEAADRGLAGHAPARLLRIAANRGKAFALNEGLATTDAGLVATVDADTRLDARALDVAARRLLGSAAAAVAFDVQVEPAPFLLSRLQAQEYACSMNFERAGQAMVGAISVLPGAATLFRSDALRSVPFRSRTLTEDADLTLELVLSGHRVGLAPDAIARTAAPADIGALLRQRIRWSTGHMQCVFHHRRGASGRGPAGHLAFADFALGTFAPLLVTGATATLAMSGPGPLFGLGWPQAVGLMVLLVYLQRLCACVACRHATEPLVFVLEPVVTGVVAGSAVFCASARLSAAAAVAVARTVVAEAARHLRQRPSAGSGRAFRPADEA